MVQSQHLVHMSPRPVARQIVRHHSLMVEPAPAMRYDGIDAFGNPVVILDIEVPHKELVLHARSDDRDSARAAIDPAATLPWDALDARLAGTGEALRPRCHAVPLRVAADDAVARDRRLRRAVVPAGAAGAGGGDRSDRRIFDDFKFDATATDVSTPITQVFKQRRGVCQDFAHLALACLRALRVPARYVSGYILTRPPPGQPKLQGADASHAWISVWAPEAGWVDLDPTNGLCRRRRAHHDRSPTAPLSGVNQRKHGRCPRY